MHMGLRIGLAPQRVSALTVTVTLTGLTIADQGGGVGQMTLTFDEQEPLGRAVTVAGYIGNTPPADGEAVASGVGADATFTVTSTVGAENVSVNIIGALDAVRDVHVAARYGSGPWSNVVVAENVAFDTAPPSIVSVSPADNATDVLSSGNIVIVFSESMDTLQGVVSIWDGLAEVLEFNLSEAAGDWSTTTEENDTLTLAYSGLAPSTGHHLRLVGMEDASGNALPDVIDPTTYNFTTAAAPSGLQIKAGGFVSAEPFTITNVAAGDMIVLLGKVHGTTAGFTVAGFTTDTVNLLSGRDNASAQVFYQKAASTADIEVDTSTSDSLSLLWLNLGNVDFFAGIKSDAGFGSGAHTYGVIPNVPANSLLIYFHARRSTTSDAGVITGHGFTLTEPTVFPASDGEWVRDTGNRFLVDVVQHGPATANSFSTVQHVPTSTLSHRGGVVVAFEPGA